MKLGVYHRSKPEEMNLLVDTTDEAAAGIRINWDTTLAKLDGTMNANGDHSVHVL
jgi:hypothetical protein